MRKLILSLCLISVSFAARAQLVISVPNASTTGTTLSELAKLTGAPSTALITATTDTSGIEGIVISGAGTTGNALIARSGQANCLFDATATVAGDYVQQSTTTAGLCHDAGAPYPTSGQVIGRVLSTQATACASAPGCAINLSGPYVQAATGASLSGNNPWTAGQAVTPVALTDAASIAVNAALSNGFTVTVAANSHTLANPTGLLVGQYLSFQITYSGAITGFATGTNYKYAGGTAPSWTGTSGAIDVLTCWAVTTSVLECSALLNVH